MKLKLSVKQATDYFVYREGINDFMKLGKAIYYNNSVIVEVFDHNIKIHYFTFEGQKISTSYIDGMAIESLTIA